MWLMWLEPVICGLTSKLQNHTKKILIYFRNFYFNFILTHIYLFTFDTEPRPLPWLWVYCLESHFFFFFCIYQTHMYHLLFDSSWLAHLFQRNLFFVFHEYFIAIKQQNQTFATQSFQILKELKQNLAFKIYLFFYFVFLAMLCGKQDLSSSTRKWTQTPWSQSAESYCYTTREVPKQNLW